jgi:hypothetical protein
MDSDRHYLTVLLAGVRRAVYWRSTLIATENLLVVPSRAGRPAGVLGAVTPGAPPRAVGSDNSPSANS